MTNIKRISNEELVNIIHEKLLQEFPDLTYIKVDARINLTGNIQNVRANLEYLDVTYKRKSDE